MDISTRVTAGELSVGLYHTAGKGTRLAPLPGAENNNKPGVKLPFTTTIQGKEVPITILESVVKQTGCYAKSRPGRLSVFWGDQVFIPTVDVEYTVAYHADILCSLGPMMSEEEWTAKGMDKYGLIAKTASGKAAQVEKVTHGVAMELLSHLDEVDAVGASLGSFSVSAALLNTLMEEFSQELSDKKGKLDSDPHLWMPMTLQRESYMGVMTKKGVSTEESGAHFDRITAMMATFNAKEENQALGTFGPVDVGQDLCWWDYGQLKLFQKNSLLCLDDSMDARLMKQFFGVPEGGSMIKGSTLHSEDIADNSSSINASIIKAGKVSKSVVSCVKTNNINAEDCILINVTANSIIAAPGSIVYNVVADEIVVKEGEVMCGVTAADSTQIIMNSKMSIDGGKAWDEKVESNQHTFGEIYSMNGDADPLSLETVINGIHDDKWSSINA